MFQEGKVTDADRLMRTVVRKNPSYAGQPSGIALCPEPPVLWERLAPLGVQS